MRVPLLPALAGGLLAAELSTTEYLGYGKALASADVRGRATGSPELEKAAAYLAGQFRSINLKPLSGDSYYQDFEVTTSAPLGKLNRLSYANGKRKQELKFQQDFVP